MTKNLCVVALVVAGCAVAEDERASVGVDVAELEACDPLNCPGNSDLIGLLGPYELDKTGVQYSSRGFRITGVQWRGLPATGLDVIGTSPQVTAGGTVYSGDGLHGLRLTLHHLPSNEDYPVEIHGSTRVPFYVSHGDPFWGFWIRYRDPITKAWKELCPYAQHVDQGVAGSWAVIWKGDRYDPITGAIFASDTSRTQVGPWFNISCAGEATVKMLRARTGGAINVASPVAQRQATLNMFTAAYCGPTGQRFTQLGQALTWSDLSGPSMIGSVSSLEAVWDADGAVCLTDHPRFVARREVDCGTRLPLCPTTVAGTWQQSGWLLSGNPVAAP
jgi:ADYC domain